MEEKQIMDILKVIMVVPMITKNQVTKSIIVQVVMKEVMQVQVVMKEVMKDQVEMKEDMEVQVVMIKALENIHIPVMFIIHQAPMIKTVQPKMTVKRVVKKK